jgi:hypothetical protein
MYFVRTIAFGTLGSSARILCGYTPLELPCSERNQLFVGDIIFPKSTVI